MCDVVRGRRTPADPLGAHGEPLVMLAVDFVILTPSFQAL